MTDPDARADARNEMLYDKLKSLLDDNAEHKKALAILLYENRKNREFIEQASIDLGRDAKKIAKSVKLFPFAYEDETLSVHEYNCLWLYARLSRKLALELYDKLRTTLPLYELAERIREAKPQREKKESLAKRVASHVQDYKDDTTSGHCDRLRDIADEPEIAKEIDALR